MKSTNSLIAGVSLILLSGSVLAEKKEWQSWPTGDRFRFGVSIYKPSIDTDLVLTAGPIRGSISLEQNFGLADSKTLPQLNFSWRFFKRHSLRANYFKLDRSGAGTAPADLTLCPDNECLPPLPVEWPVNSYVDVDVLNIGYDYSVVFTEKMDWTLGVGLSVQDFRFGILTDDPFVLPGQSADQIEVESKFTAPLPTLATSFTYALTDKWLLRAAFNWLEVDFSTGDSGKFDGSILGLDAAIQWKTFKHVGFILSYQAFDLDLKVDDGDEFSGDVKYDYRGPRLGVLGYF